MPLAGDGVKIVFEAVDKDAVKKLAEIEKKLKTLNDEIDENSKSNDEAADSQESFFGALMASNFATKVLDAGLNFLVATIKQSIVAAQEAELVYARVEATLQSTGREAEFTAKQLAEMAQDFSVGTMFDDEGILEAMNALLRFDSVSSESLPKITALAIDMAAALGTDVASAANILGGALETGLLPKQLKVDQATRAQFKSFVELGDEAGALGLMLDVLGKKFEGQAEKMGATSAGAAAQVKVSWGNYLEAQGAATSQSTAITNRWLADYLAAETTAIEVRTRAIEIMHEQGNEGAAYSSTLGMIVGATNDEIKAALAAAAAEREHKEAIAGVRREGEDGVNIVINFSSTGFDDVDAQIDSVFSHERQINFMLQFQSNADSSKKELDDLKEQQVEAGKEVADLRAKRSAEGLTEEEAAALDAAIEKYGEITGEIANAVAEQEKFKKNLAFQMLFEKFKEGGLSDEEMGALLEFGKELGVLDEETITAVTDMLAAVTEVDPGNLDDALSDIKELVAMDGKTVTIYVNQVTTTTEGGTTTGNGTTTTDGATTTGSTTTSGTIIPVVNVTFTSPGLYTDILAGLRG